MHSYENWEVWCISSKNAPNFAHILECYFKVTNNFTLLSMYAISHMFDSEVESLKETQAYILRYILNSRKLGGVADWHEMKRSSPVEMKCKFPT
jgi:hypothetical protein